MVLQYKMYQPQWETCLITLSDIYCRTVLFKMGSPTHKIKIVNFWYILLVLKMLGVLVGLGISCIVPILIWGLLLKDPPSWMKITCPSFICAWLKLWMLLLGDDRSATRPLDGGSMEYFKSSAGVSRSSLLKTLWLISAVSPGQIWVIELDSVKPQYISN